MTAALGALAALTLAAAVTAWRRENTRAGWCAALVAVVAAVPGAVVGWSG